MEYETNPFQELYVTDSPDLNVFVNLFSDYPVQHAQILFRPGNVILKGSQGSGKSMLLNLFRPEIRIAYKNSGIEFPIPKPFARFIGAGINLTRSGTLNIGQRAIVENIEKDEEEFPFYFGDFLNYFIVRDILKTVETQEKQPEVFELQIDSSKLNQFASEVSKNACWFGALDGCNSFDELCKRIESRIEAYRRFHNNRTFSLPVEFFLTKTDIGEPIAIVAEYLKTSGVVPNEVPFFIRIDQIERLSHCDVIRPSLGKQFRRIINKAIGKRDHRVSYRIGTRTYAWEDDLFMFGTADKLEQLRDYRISDIDDILRRQEDPKTWIFPQFAEDVFKRRLQYANYDEVDTKKDPLAKVFGASPEHEEAAKQYAGNSSVNVILKMDDKWPAIWKEFLAELFKEDPLEAILASVWVRQRGISGKSGGRIKDPPPSNKPWNKTYWRKERIRQALMQIAARARQRMKWSGKDLIIALSSGNISIFLSICYEIWESFLRFNREKKERERCDPISGDSPINPDIQAVGIHTASTQWYGKITEQPKGDDRQRFLDVLGRTFRTWLLNDDAMSYPGNNGFSIAIDDLKKFPSLAEFLKGTVDYGDLYDAPHTTKKKDRRQRIKWYLSPILSPYFQIPEAHQKEPYYLDNMEDLILWLKKAEIHIKDLPEVSKRRKKTTTKKIKQHKHPSLFDYIGGD